MPNPVEDLSLSVATIALLARLDDLHDQRNPERANFQHAWCQGYLTALMMIGTITPDQRQRLAELAANAREHAPCLQIAP
ncbi:hypothetical protein HG264_04165 [Pseudomonas sp. gcc21]|uniref:hypothetical protein n=1 Tax=Pseudomonas sp. gcc21 TaxID=2726989 RepID=UPI0014514490|nr:hypothetical protein [Pseudomonas sp. gcc21]QJD58166.1 hypothetical protein HG264_04165 [Pseudomonas sp. gcc21]